jgi:hypothetical protein
MQFDPGIPDTEEYYDNDGPRIARMLTAIAIILALGPISCDDMSLPWWSSTSRDDLNLWYDRMETLGASIFLFSPLLLFLSDRLHRWLSRGIIRWSIVALHWSLVLLFLLYVDEPWYPVTITGWQTHEQRVIEHPIFAGCFYLSALLSGILWVTFRGDRRWALRVAYEFLPLVLLIIGRIWLSMAERPEFTWG